MPISKKRKRDNVTPSQKNCDNLIGFQAGNHCICSGASGRGKTWYVVDAILGSGVHKGCGSPWDAVIVMCDNISIHQPVYKKLANQFKGKGKVTFIEGLPADNEEEFLDMCKENHEKGMKTICVIDDLMTASRSGKTDQFVCKLFTSARHLGVDVWSLTKIIRLPVQDAYKLVISFALQHPRMSKALHTLQDQSNLKQLVKMSWLPTEKQQVVKMDMDALLFVLINPNNLCFEIQTCGDVLI